jgi:hypothetical protein
MPMNETPDHPKQTLSIALMIAAVVVIAALAYWQLQRSTSSEPVEAPVSEPIPAVAEMGVPELPSEESVAAAAGAAEMVELREEAPRPLTQNTARLPQLDRSDTDVISHLLEVSDGGFQSWLIQEHLIRKFVRAVNALEEGKLVSQYRPFAAPESTFSALKTGESWQIQPENYQRYTPYLESLEQVGPAGLAQLYQHYSPLLQQAYEELGVDKGSFKDVTLRALTRISKTPIPPADTPLARPSVTYKFAAPELEQRSAVEKLLFRLGPDNSARLKKLASELLTELQSG